MCSKMSRSSSIPGATSISSQPFRRQLEHAALGDVEHPLPSRGGEATVEGDLLDRRHELAAAAFLGDAQPAVARSRPEPAGGEGAGEDHGPSVLRDVDEAAGPGEPAAEPADIDVAGRSAWAMPRQAKSSPPPS